tara:strand:+ start:310 stop:492 length:183 start_codon:yes stop_codon:yes gene_type:complete
MTMESPDIKNKESQIVSSSNVICDGGGGALGHPRIYLDMGNKKKIICPYCSKAFVLENNN